MLSLTRFAIAVHRWLGVALCLLFLIWFPSGIGMMYWDFPSVTPADRLERSPALNPSTVVLSPADALARTAVAAMPGDMRLNTFDGRPVYRIRVGGEETVVYADTGEQQADVSREMMDRIAAAWTGQPADAATVESIEAVDQWTVQSALRNLRPLWKYSWTNGEQVYVAQASGDVVQYTTTTSRIGAYVGAIPHWLYFTPLRKHQAQWSALVIWTSGIGTGAAMLGVVIALVMFSPSRRYRYAGRPTSIPYRGWKRWHAMLGLIVGLGAVTWAFSGMLSMDPFPARTSGPAGPGSRRGGGGLSQALRGRMQMAAFAARHPRDVLAQLTGLDVKQLVLTSFAGESVYLATLANGATRIIPIDRGPSLEVDRQRLIEVVTEAAAPNGGASIQQLDQYDAYYLDRHRGRPLPVILVRMHDAEQTRYYVDPKTARVVATYSSRNWVTRWLYHGLHSLDFPWLYNYRPVWDIVVIAFMLGGTALSVTSLMLAWRVVGRQLRAGGTARPSLASDDLIVETE